MSREDRVIRNSAILTLQHILLNVVAICVVGYIARYLGKEDYGIYSLAFAFPLIFESIGSLGLRLLALREISRNREHAIDYLGQVVPARSILILIMGCVTFFAALLLNYETKIIHAIVIAIGASIFEQFSRIILDVFQAFEEMGKVVFRDVTVRLFTAVASISVLFLGYGLYAVCMVYFLGSVLGLIINIWMFSRRFEYPKMRFEFVFLRDSIKEGSSFVLIGFTAALLSKIDILMISKLADNESLGIYNASYNLFSRLNFLADAIATALFPALCELYWINRDEANIIFNKALLTILILSLPIAIGGFIMSEQIITLIYGNSYLDSVKVFSLLIISTPLMFVATLLIASLNAIKQQRFVALAISVAVVFSFISNILFINWIGYLGAAVAQLLTKTALFAIVLYGSWRYYKFIIAPNTAIAIIISLAVLGCVTYLTRSLGIFITVPLAAAVYYACLKISGQLKNIAFTGKSI